VVACADNHHAAVCEPFYFMEGNSMITKTICLSHKPQTESETLETVKEMYSTMPNIVMSPREWLHRRAEFQKREVV
jgi:hypothetical protein